MKNPDPLFQRSLVISLYVLLAASFWLSACNLFTLPFKTLFATALPLPPVLIEADPPSGSQIPLQSSITFYFSQPMQRASVEAAVTGQPTLSGRFTWQDDATLVFTPAQPFQPNIEQGITIGASARAANGLAMQAPVTLIYPTADYLRGTQFLPEPGASDVIPSSAVVLTFNQPVVPLGADPGTLPAAFTLEPVAAGRGEWLNTSTCIFYPEPPLSGGVTYTAHLNPGLVSTAGSPFDPASQVDSWSFTTALPRLVSLEPASEKPLPLDGELTLTFNQPMDAASVQGGFVFSGPDGLVDGKFNWNEDYSVLTFTPAGLLARDTAYTLVLSAEVQARGGTPLGQEQRLSLRTYPDFYVTGTDPLPGETISRLRLEVTFSTPVEDVDLADLVKLTPEVPSASFDLHNGDQSLIVYGYFDYATSYALAVSPDLKDAWGASLGKSFELNCRTPLAPALLVIPYFGSNVMFMTPGEAEVYAQAASISAVDLTIAPVSLNTFIALSAPDAYEARTAYTPANPTRWRQGLSLIPNRSQPVTLKLSPPGKSLSSDIYYVSIQAPEAIKPGDRPRTPFFAVISNINLTFKIGATDALVWAVDLRNGAPAAAAPVAVYDEEGNVLASGQTDAQGLWQAPIPTQEDPNQFYLAVLGQPGESTFALAPSDWNQEISPWDFDINASRWQPHTEVYFYTDRPIYRPGQTVYFRSVVREAFNGRYADPNLDSLPLSLTDPRGQEIKTFDLPLSKFGTLHGSFALPEDAPPGTYYFRNQDLDLYAYFEVADYRKPEINLSVQIAPEQIKSGQSIQAQIDARYYFDAPAGNLPIYWALYARPDDFELPEYTTGQLYYGWLLPYSEVRDVALGDLVGEGEGKTDASGKLALTLSDIPEQGDLQYLTLEVTAQDESGLPLSGRANARIHPADFYIGLRPDQWIGQAGTTMGFEVLTVDWEQNPSSSRSLHAEFQQVTWERKGAKDLYGLPAFEPVFTPVGSSDLVTGADGKARLSFKPSQPGTYVLSVKGDEAYSQVLLWVGGAGQAVWPNLPNQHLRLTADRELYRPGQTARVFIPNPYGEKTLALVTVERGVILDSQVIELDESGSTFSLPLTDDHAPNVYISATLIDVDDFRQGYLNLAVEPKAQALHVELTSQPERAQPGEQVTLALRVTDAQGKPVQGEFSLSVVDLAALALADPNALDILPAFYGEQPLGIRTSLALAAFSKRFAPSSIESPGGLGGGGGGEAMGPIVRENFPDTAYWNPTLVTDAGGSGQVTLTLPDSLTTWHVDARGLTSDTRVGQAETQVITTKPLLIRPVTPRFLVAGDHVELAAIVHNNTDKNLQTSANLKVIGFSLDKTSKPSQTVKIPAGGRVRLTWWGTAQDTDSADLLFSVKASGVDQALQDAARPVWGALPVLHYTAPQTFVTAGVLPEAGSRLEIISLPRTFVPTGGGLNVEMSPSLAAAVLDALEAMKEPSSNAGSERVLSYVLPNLAVYRSLQGAGLESPALKERLDGSLDDSLRRLLALQNSDGGWGWYAKGQSNPYITGYTLFGLQQIKEAGVRVDEKAIQNGRDFLVAARPYLGGESPQVWEMERLAFSEFILQETGGAGTQAVEALYGWRDRLSPWARALLALTLEDISPGETRARELISNLETTAIRSASGAHWEVPGEDWRDPGTPRFTTALVVYALAQRDPAAPILTDAVRYLASQRSASGQWGSPYETAWVILALNEAMQGSGELQSDFAFSADLNGTAIISGQSSGPANLTAVTAGTPIDKLYSKTPNALTFSRQPGNGRLYYRAALQVDQPVELVKPLKQGMLVDRAYYDPACKQNCSVLDSVKLDPGARLAVHLTLSLPHDSYYVMLEDYIPAGSEILNKTLTTSQEGRGPTTWAEFYDPHDPIAGGWGWWLIDAPQIFDDHILWMAEYLPAGTYTLTYTLIPLQAGKYRLLPAHAWQAYFPEVQGTSAGAIFEIKP